MQVIKKFSKKVNRRFVAISYDTGAIALSWLLAFEIHQNLELMPKTIFINAIAILPLIIVLKLVIFYLLGLYRSVWRFASLSDLMQITKSVLLGSVILATLIYVSPEKNVVARSILPLYTILLLGMMSFGRFFVRWCKDCKNNSLQESKRTLIIGFNTDSERLIREMLRKKNCYYTPVAIISANTADINCSLHRVPIVGGIKDIAKTIEKYHIDLVLIALNNASSEAMNQVVTQCAQSKVLYRIIPNFLDAIDNNRVLSAIRKVKLEDLLSREVYQVDVNLFHQFIQNKRILVTGGGGSIGSELCRQIVSLKPEALMIVDHSESNLYHIDLELRRNFSNISIQIALINILDFNLLEMVFDKFKPDIVFHAAAYKHVPMLEFQLIVAVRNNIVGSKNVLDLSVKYNVNKHIQISTDKAVNPTNIMGMTKRVVEIYCEYMNKLSHTKVITVRFGNVLGSVGSVVPLFQTQFNAGGPLTVTHPEVERYFMTISEACRLILQAMTMGEGGEIFVLDMGDPIKIKTIAEQIIHLSGKKINEDIQIVYAGLRAGEKLREELFYAKESVRKTSHKKILEVKETILDPDLINKMITELMLACDSYDERKILAALQALVPEYRGNQGHSPSTPAHAHSLA